MHAAARTGKHIPVTFRFPWPVSFLENDVCFVKKKGAISLSFFFPVGHSSVVKALLMKGSKVDAKTRSNYTVSYHLTKR